MQIKESAENYLEAILVLKRKKGYVRSIDIANELHVTKPSVSVAMKHFREEGLITAAPDGAILLTEKGQAIAERVYARHQTIAAALLLMGVSEETAYEDSCKIEHDISEETFLRLREYVERHSEK